MSSYASALTTQSMGSSIAEMIESWHDNKEYLKNEYKSDKMVDVMMYLHQYVPTLSLHEELTVHVGQCYQDKV